MGGAQDGGAAGHLAAQRRNSRGRHVFGFAVMILLVGILVGQISLGWRTQQVVAHSTGASAPTVGFTEPRPDRVPQLERLTDTGAEPRDDVINPPPGSHLAAETVAVSVPATVLSDASVDPIPQLQGMADEAAARGGGIVNVPAGNHALVGTLTLWQNTTLRGTGTQSCLVMRQGGTDLIHVAGSHVTIEDLCLVGPEGIASLGGNGPGKAITNTNNAQVLYGVTIRRLLISNVSSMGIYLSGSSRAWLRDIVVADNVIRGSGGHGIAVGFADGGRVANNSLDETATGGMTFGDGGIDLEGISNFAVDGNRVEHSVAAGIQMDRVDWSTISNNIVDKTNPGNGFAFWNSNHDTITGNVATNNQERGFLWAWNESLGPMAGSNVIRGNWAQANGTNGFQLYEQSDVEFVNNTAIDNNGSDSGASGLVIQQWCARISVNGNVFRNSAFDAGQMYGISTPDQSTKGLQVGDDNTFFRMRAGDTG